VATLAPRVEDSRKLLRCGNHPICRTVPNSRGAESPHSAALVLGTPAIPSISSVVSSAVQLTDSGAQLGWQANTGREAIVRWHQMDRNYRHLLARG